MSREFTREFTREVNRESDALPTWASDALRAPAPSTAAARARIMSAVRSLPAPRRMVAPIRPTRWLRRGLLSPIGGLMTTVVMAATIMLRVGSASAPTELTALTRTLGDSVVPARSESLSDTHWLDTLRIVEFVLRGPSIQRAMVLGDFNQWRRGATPMVASMAAHEWRARVLVPRDALATTSNAALLVNEENLVGLRPSLMR